MTTLSMHPRSAAGNCTLTPVAKSPLNTVHRSLQIRWFEALDGAVVYWPIQLLWYFIFKSQIRTLRRQKLGHLYIWFRSILSRIGGVCESCSWCGQEKDRERPIFVYSAGNGRAVRRLMSIARTAYLPKDEMDENDVKATIGYLKSSLAFLTVFFCVRCFPSSCCHGPADIKAKHKTLQNAQKFKRYKGRTSFDLASTFDQYICT